MVSNTLAEWRALGKYFNFRGHEIFYRRSGTAKKPVILLIHGFPTAAYDFAPIWNLLAKKYTLLTADMLGFGFSAKPARHYYSILEQADVFEALLAHEKITAYHVLAHDYGVSVAQELLARQADKKNPMLSVSFLNGGLYPEFHKPLMVQKLMLGPLGPLLTHFFTRKKLRASFDKIFGTRKPTEEEMADFWELINYNGGKSAIPRLLQYMNERKCYRERWVTAMETTRVPVQMINGPTDPISGSHLAQAFAERNPRAEVHSLPGVGHYPQIEAPEKTVELYLGFLRGVG